MQNKSHTLPRQKEDHRRDARKEIDGHFPSIDAVIAEPQSDDKRRQLGETEFYEHTGDDSVTRRRSMMRTVNKDDCLVGRGANPRTGLITPDWNSVTSSLDNEYIQSARRDRPSAQWKLDGDAWVSVPPQEHSADDPTIGQLGAQEYIPQLDRVSSALSSRTASRKHSTTALTEKNLRTFSNQSQLDQLAEETIPHIGATAEGTKIKRKPVGSPSAAPTSTNLARDAIRSASHDTVVHSPDAKTDFAAKYQRYPEYYSPDSIGAGLHKSDTTNFPQRARNVSPFLGVPVELRTNMTLQPRGFTGRITNRNQLQESLRTSSGPYPSRPSNQQAALGKANYVLHSHQIQHDHLKKSINPLRGHRVPHQPVLKAYHPDDVISSKPTEIRSQLQDLPQFGPQNGKLTRRKLDPTVGSREDHRYPDLSNDSNIQQMLNTTYTTTNIHIPISGRRVVQDILPQPHDYMSSVHDIYPDQHHMVLDGTGKYREVLEGCMNKETRSEKRPQLGPREQGMLRIPKIRIERTDMVHRNHSNTIGTTVTQSDEGDTNRVVRLTEVPKTPPAESVASSEAISPVTNDQMVLYDEERLETSDARGQDVGISNDHTACCPECCVKYDCHGGCLGHTTPNASVAGSETSSLVSMGIFDASFETSVKAVNKALLTPMETGNGRFAKVRTIFGLKSGTSSPTESSKPNTMKRTLRDESLSQKVNVGLDRPRPIITGPIDFDTKQAKTAAIRALDAGESSKENLTEYRKARTKTKTKSTTNKTVKISEDNKVVKVTEANEGRRITSQGRKTSKSNASNSRTPPSNSSETTLIQSETDEQEGKEAALDQSKTDHQNAEAMSMVDRVGIFIRRNSSMVRPKCISFTGFTDPVLLSYARPVALTVKDMTVTIADTTAVVITIMLEYYKTGKLVVPAGTSANELAGNLLRSVLYLIIATCVYAMFLKAGRFVLAVLRVVLLPVRVCAWIIG